MTERKVGDTWVFERRELRVVNPLRFVFLLASVWLVWSIDLPYVEWFLLLPITILLKPALELRVDPESVTRRLVWWIPGYGNIGTAGQSISRSSVDRVCMQRRKTGSSETGSDTMVWTPTLRAEKKLALWTFGSQGRAETLNFRLAELFDVGVNDEYGNLVKPRS